MGDFLNLSSSNLFSPNNFMGEFRIQVFYYLIATLIILSGHNIFFMVFGLKKIFFCRSLLFVLQYCFCFMFWSPGIRDLSFLTRDQTHIPCIGRQSLNHSTAREFLFLMFLIIPITLKFAHL